MVRERPLTGKGRCCCCADCEKRNQRDRNETAHYHLHPPRLIIQRSVNEQILCQFSKSWENGESWLSVMHTVNISDTLPDLAHVVLTEPVL